VHHAPPRGGPACPGQWGMGSWPVCSDADGACLQHVATMRSLHISIMAGTVSQAAGIPASLAQQGGSREG
jgi:hypothetical protein